MPENMPPNPEVSTSLNLQFEMPRLYTLKIASTALKPHAGVPGTLYILSVHTTVKSDRKHMCLRNRHILI